MARKKIKIDREKCTGCGLCAKACAEGAIAMINGKAELVREDFCDGLGNCLPACPAGAISFEEKGAAEAKRASEAPEAPRAATGCPGCRTETFGRRGSSSSREENGVFPESELTQWPVQIRLVPANAPYFDGAHLLVAADCTAYAFAGFHRKFIKGRVALVGCPKLDGVDYAEKLAEILRSSDVKSVTVVRMQVPCCAGLESAVERALALSGKKIPRQVFVISPAGQIARQPAEGQEEKTWRTKVSKTSSGKRS
jgi:ferredoxin